MDIPSIGLSASIEPIRLDANGDLDPGNDFINARWWEERGKPGRGSLDTTYIIGHTVAAGGGVFDRVPKLFGKAGEKITVTVDGKPVSYVITRTVLYDKVSIGSIDELWDPVDPERLVVITCFTEDGQRTDKNFVVYADLSQQ